MSAAVSPSHEEKVYIEMDRMYDFHEQMLYSVEKSDVKSQEKLIELLENTWQQYLMSTEELIELYLDYVEQGKITKKAVADMEKAIRRIYTEVWDVIKKLKVEKENL